MDDQKCYYQRVHFWGRVTLSLAILFFLGICLYLSFVLRLHPGWEVILTAFLGMAATVGHTWVNLSDQVTYLLLMGPAATYMSMLTGNVKNMRLPSALASCAMVEEHEGQMKRDILAAYGVATSIFVNTFFLIILAVAGQFILEILPPALLRGLDYIVPALFGAIFAQFSFKNAKVAVVSLGIVLLVYHLSFIPSFLRVFTAIVTAIIANIVIQRFGTQKEDLSEDCR